MAGGQGALQLRDLSRVALRVSLVCNEMLLKSPSIKKLKAGDIVGSTAITLKYMQNAVVDIAGLTQGRLRSHMPFDNASQFESATSSALHSNTPKFSPGSRFSSDNSYSNKVQTTMSQPEELFHPSTFVSSTDNRQSSTLAAKNISGEGTVPLKDELYGATCISGRDKNFSPSGNAAILDEATSATSKLDSDDKVLGEASDLIKEERKPVGASERGSEGGIALGMSDIQVGSTVDLSRPVLKKRKSRERRVPSTPLGRVIGFAGLGAGLAWGTVQECARRMWQGQRSNPAGQSALSPFMTEQNAKRIAAALCRMRGAALKVGQMLSIQDESLVPAPILQALESARQGAHVMPRKQLDKVLNSELGPSWRERLSKFDYKPIAAASIGQVHKAIMHDGREVAMKVQYPGVAVSINSDIDNVRLLLDYTNLIPKGLYLDQAINVAKEELTRECDYRLEAINQKKFRKFLQDEPGLYVPLVIDKLSTRGVLTTELVRAQLLRRRIAGVSIDKVATLDQSIRNRVGSQLLDLTLRELFVFHFMQTDPNWGNFLYEESSNTINLIDFGAARGFTKDFVDDYMKMIFACANRDRKQIIKQSIRLGFLTGEEEEVMIDAHTRVAYATGEPFSKMGGFDFRNSNLPRQKF